MSELKVFTTSNITTLGHECLYNEFAGLYHSDGEFNGGFNGGIIDTSFYMDISEGYDFEGTSYMAGLRRDEVHFGSKYGEFT